jgi:hypothetical protein
MKTARLIAAVLILAGLAAGGKTFSAFSKTTSNASDRLQSARIFPHDRTVVAQKISDASGAAANDATNPVAYADSLLLTTSAAATTFASNRYLDIELAGYVPDGLTPTSVQAEIDFGDNNIDAQRSCLYFETRRASTDAVLNTWGSPASPLACNSGTIPTPVTQTLTAVTSAAIANDLKLRLYFSDEGANAVLISRVVVRFVSLGHTWTVRPIAGSDSLDTTPGALQWGLAKADGSSWQNSTIWPAAYNAAKYVTFGFPDAVPASAIVSAASFEYRWANNAAGTHCFYFEVYNGATLIGTHGSTGSPFCTSSTTQATSTVSLPEVNTPDRANNATVKLYVWGGGRTNFDLVALHHSYQLAPSGCVDAGQIRIPATRDTSADQNAAAVVQGGGADIKVRSDTTKNKRGFVWFYLPTVPDGCSLTSATLRAYLNTTQSARTITVDRASASWLPNTLTWSNQPSTAGTTVSDTNSPVGWHSWTVTSLVQAMYSGSNNGFVLKDGTEGAAIGAEQKYDALEKPNGNTPELLLTYG